MCSSFPFYYWCTAFVYSGSANGTLVATKADRGGNILLYFLFHEFVEDFGGRIAL